MREAGVKNAVMIVVWKLWNFIIAIRLKRTSVSPVKGIREAGSESGKSWINALCFVPIVTGNFTLKVSSP